MQKNNGTVFTTPYLYSLAESKGFFRRTDVRLRIASLFNHGLSNSPPDCFHRQSRPSLFESLAVSYQQKNKGYSKRYTLYSLAESKGFFRRTAVRLRIASLFNHGLSNSPPDCFHRQSRPSLFESLAVSYQQKNKGYSKRYTLYSLAESKGFFRRTAVRLRIASLFNHGLSNSPPDCFHRQSRPSLFETLAVLSTKK